MCFFLKTLMKAPVLFFLVNRERHSFVHHRAHPVSFHHIGMREFHSVYFVVACGLVTCMLSLLLLAAFAAAAVYEGADGAAAAAACPGSGSNRSDNNGIAADHSGHAAAAAAGGVLRPSARSSTSSLGGRSSGPRFLRASHGAGDPHAQQFLALSSWHGAALSTCI